MTRRWISPLLPLLLCAVAYSPAPFGDFVWDDVAVVEFQLERFTSFQVVLRPPQGIVRWSYEYFRPVVVGSYLFDQAVFGANSPAGWHAMNVLYHLLTTGLVWLLLRRLLATESHGAVGACIGAALFAVHPIHTESVSWMAGRSDVLALLFLLATLLCACSWQLYKSRVALLALPFLFLAALLSKESALVGLGLMALLPAVLPDRAPMQARATRWIAALAVALAAAAAWYWLRERAGVTSGVPQDAGLTEEVTRLVRATGYYLSKLVMPWPQSNLVPWELAPGLAVSTALTGSAVLATVATARTYWRGGSGVALFAWSWLWITLSVPLWIAIGNATNTPLAERYLYIPSVALSIGVALAVARTWDSRWWSAALGLSGVVLMTLTALSIQRGLVWQDDIALWTDATRGGVARGLAWTNLGLNLMEAGDEEAALRALSRAGEDAELDPRWVSRSENGIGTLYARRGDLVEAEAHFRAALRAMPDYHEPYYGLGDLYAKRAAALTTSREFASRDAAAENAIAQFVAALGRNALYHPARLRLATFLFEYGKWLEAEGEVDKARRRYVAGLEQVDSLFELIPEGRREYALVKLHAALGVDPLELRRQLTARASRE